MPRLPRSVLPPEGFYHLTVRGVARMPIVLDDADRRRWLRLMKKSASRFGWTVHVYCLMNNHFHLVVEATLEDVSLGMHRLNGIYAQRFNERHDRVGHLFQERFHAKVVRDDEHFVEACEYVLANPVRAGLCKSPEEWPWSGLRVHGGERRRPRAQRRHVAVAPVHSPVTERVLGLQQLVNLRRPFVDDRRPRVAEVPLDPVLGGVAVRVVHLDREMGRAERRLGRVPLRE